MSFFVVEKVRKMYVCGIVENICMCIGPPMESEYIIIENVCVIEWRTCVLL